MISPAAQWPEWLTCVPLLFYVALSCDMKEFLEWKDILMIGLITTTIFTGFSLNFGFSDRFNFISLLLSCLSCVSVGFLAVEAQTALKDIVASESGPGIRTITNIEEEANPIERYKAVYGKAKQLEFTLKKRNIALVCLVGMPIFPIIYFLALFRFLHDDTAYSATMIASMLVKSIIASIVSENSFVEGLEDVEVVLARGNLERKVEEVRKTVQFATSKFYRVQFEVPPDAAPLDQSDSHAFFNALHGYKIQGSEHENERHSRRSHGFNGGSGGEHKTN